MSCLEFCSETTKFFGKLRKNGILNARLLLSSNVSNVLDIFATFNTSRANNYGFTLERRITP